MIKNRTIIEVEVKGREYQLVCCCDSPLTEVQEALTLIQNYVQERLKGIPSQNEENSEVESKQVEFSEESELRCHR
jgi:molybdopterin-guanine dinucleotide biosynthesis protein A